MKKIKHMAWIAAACFATSAASAAVVFTDTFDYTVDNAMIDEGGWTAWSGEGGSDAGSGIFWGGGDSGSDVNAWIDYNHTNALVEGEVITMDANVNRAGRGYTMTIDLWDGSDAGTRTTVAGGVEESPAGTTLATVGYTVTAADAGKQAIFRYAHTDNWGETADVTFQIVDASTPAPPEWNESPIEESGIVGRDFTGTLDGKATDPNFETVYYYKDTGPDWLVVATNGALSGIPVSSGTNVFTVLADDGNTTPATNTLNIAVSEALPPAWLEDPIQGSDALVGSTYNGTLAGKAEDPNGDPITYSLVSPSSTWLEVADDGSLSGMPELGDAGSNTFVVAVTDNIDGSTNAVLNIFVAEAPEPPEIVLVDNTTANGSFELPDSGKVQFNTGNIPSWDNWSEVDTADDDTGVDGSGETQNGMDGAYVAFLQSGGAIVNMVTDAPHTIKVGDVIVYSFWNSNPGRGDAAISLVYDDAGTRTEIPGTSITTAPGTQAIGQLTVQAGDAWVGSALGVGIVDTAGGWPEVDQIMLGVTPKPAAAVTDLVISGPVSSGTEMVLSWTGEDGASYTVKTNSNLIFGSWEPFMSGIPGIDGAVTVTNAIGPDQTFYRVITE